MTFGDKVAREALDWVGTPLKPNQSQKGRGCDCKGLVVGVARELGRPEADAFHALICDYRLDRPLPSQLLLEGMIATFDRVEQMRAGDVLLLNHCGRPGHLAIVTREGRAVHTQISSRAWVKETDLRALFHFYPLNSIWRWRRKGR